MKLSERLKYVISNQNFFTRELSAVHGYLFRIFYSIVQPKSNAQARTSFCDRKKKFFLWLIGDRLSLSPGNRKNFFAVV